MSDQTVTPPAQATPEAGASKTDATIQTPQATQPPAHDSTKTPVQDQAKQPPVESKKDATAAPEKTPEKTQDASKDKPVVPEKYDLKIPEGSLLKAEATEKIAAFAKERGFSNEQAQALLERESSNLKSFQEANLEAFNKKAGEWLEQAKNDKEIGGEALNENAELAKRVVKKYGSEDFAKELNSTGFGNHPELLRIFVRVGKAMGEDKLIIPNAQGGGKRSIEDALWGGNEKAT